MKKATLSLVMIAKNAERHLDEVLASATFADEILIYDSFSTDKTPEIAGKYATRVYQKEWLGFSESKNFLLAEAKSDWILVLDADEVILPEMREEILSLLASNPAESCFEITFDNLIFGRNMGATMCKPVLLRRGVAQFEGKVHERLVGPESRGRLKNRIRHYAYDDLDQYLEKFNRYTRLDAEQLLAGPELSLFQTVFQGMLWRGFKDFLRRYFYRSLWRFGVEGFLFSFFSAVYRVAQYGKYYLMARERRALKKNDKAQHDGPNR